jgi:Flp pilus assembly protein TadB
MIRSVTPRQSTGLSDERLAAAAEWSSASVLARLSARPPESDTLADQESTLAHVMNCVAQALPETQSRIGEIRADLKRAGDYQPQAYQRLAARRFAGMLLSLVMFGTLTIFAFRETEPWYVLALAVGMFASWSVPVWRLQRRAARRIDQIEQAIPDLLDLTKICLSQGLSVPSTLATVSRDLRPLRSAMADELAIVCRQAELVSLETALEAFEERIDLPEIRSFVSLLLQADDRALARSDV